MLGRGGAHREEEAGRTGEEEKRHRPSPPSSSPPGRRPPERPSSRAPVASDLPVAAELCGGRRPGHGPPRALDHFVQMHCRRIGEADLLRAGEAAVEEEEVQGGGGSHGRRRANWGRETRGDWAIGGVRGCFTREGGSLLENFFEVIKNMNAQPRSLTRIYINMHIFKLAGRDR